MDDLQKFISNAKSDNDFESLYLEETELAELAVQVAMARQKEGLTQAALAVKAHVTQQQVSKIERGLNCNTLTLLRILNALKVKISFQSYDMVDSTI
jgi:HTH-type transcriptional regulator / antitoxin HipB